MLFRSGKKIFSLLIRNRHPQSPNNLQYDKFRNFLLDKRKYKQDRILKYVPYKQHPTSPHIEDSEQIWRVMTFDKFMGILEYQSLFFARADRLGDDLYEGHFPKSRIRGNITDISSLVSPEGEVGLKISKSKNQELDDKIYRGLAQMQGRCLFANCWYRSKYESNSLWKMYSQRNRIAIRSTIGKFKKSFESSEPQIYILK